MATRFSLEKVIFANIQLKRSFLVRSIMCAKMRHKILVGQYSLVSKTIVITSLNGKVTMHARNVPTSKLKQLDLTV